jgi:phosphoenolpyruvate synthase/pyruvate phosphate dikinase
MIIDTSKYQRLFQFSGFVPFIVSYDFVRAYVDLDGLAHSDQDSWLSYMSSLAYKKTLQAGLTLYKNSASYDSFKKELYDTYKKIVKESSAIAKSKTITKKQASDYLSLLKKYRILYQKTESFYTDLAFEKKSEFKGIVRNFKSFGDFKLDGRKYLNEIFFVPNSHFYNFLKKIAEQFEVKYEDLLSYSTEEVLDLFKGTVVDKKDIKQREDCYVIFAKEGKIKFIAGKEAKNAIEATKNTEQLTVLKGQIANKGKVIATVKVMKIDLSKYDQISATVKSMKEGQVLVAETTEPAIIMACKKASAIVTNQGGMMSHAAIVARELGIPCIVGTRNATEVLKDGDKVEVDADKGTVKILKKN